ncbi:MAG: DUF1552 domain-containing protein [Proteobacteria bacterium]|nr:DUF1552 domain-containing protein [Pseudomonadota bacterium]MCP4920486.1 DUF1552 domain-containing protein [Pseudomonadota bacterium]
MKRRTFLRGVLRTGGLVCVGLPALELFWGRQAKACDGVFPQRFGVWFWGNGNRPDRWTPTGEGADWELSDELSPLAALKDDITVVSGFSTKVDNLIPHWSGLCGLLTGLPEDGPENGWTVRGPTLDQVVAQEIGNDTIYRSLEVGVTTTGAFSYNGPNSQNPAEMDPYTLYERIFGETFREPGEGGLVDPSLGYRRSALDAVMDDISSLQGELGYSDRVRLEQHLDGVRDLETRLARLQEDPPELEACVRPDAPELEYADIDGRPQISAVSRTMSHLTAMALACDQTRVFSFTLSGALNNELWPDADDGHHNLTHHEVDDQPQVDAITTFNMAEYAYFLETLKAVPEGDGTLLDSCLVLATSEVSEGRTHSLDEIPIVLAGSACGQIVQGQHIRSYTQENVNKVSLSLLRAMGVSQASWGSDDNLATDVVSELLT